jgi:glycosyltransferase involved in cell wall biosynthesis
MPRVCFVQTEMNYAFEGSKSRTLGGAELQTYLLAKELSKDMDVSVILKDKVDAVEGIRTLSIGRKRLVNLLFLFKAMRDARADIYYQRTGGFISGLVALYCRLAGKRFILNMSSIGQCQRDSPKGKGLLVRAFYRWALSNASRIIAQTDDQQRELMKNFGLDSTLIRNIASIPQGSQNMEGRRQESLSGHQKQDMVLWVGTVCKRKNPEAFLELAERLGKYKFVMIGPWGDDENRGYYDSIKKRACSINVDFLGFKPIKETEAYYQMCKVLVNTTLVDEGFPNTYLQAWSNRSPVVALKFDPDEVICRHKLGLHSKCMENLVRDTRMLMENDALRQSMANNGRLYVEDNHDTGKVVASYKKVFNSMMI